MSLQEQQQPADVQIGAVDTAVVDVDGTLVDTNYHHTLAWARAFARQKLFPPAWRIHRAIGMGGDRLVAAVGGDDTEARVGDALRAAWTEEFDPPSSRGRPASWRRGIPGLPARERAAGGTGHIG